MADINVVVIVGRLTREAELKVTAGGGYVCSFALASNYRTKRGEEWVDDVSFFDCVLFGNRASALAEYLSKGRQVAVRGSLRQERWEDRNTGTARSRVKIHVDDLELLGKGGEPGAGAQREEAAPSATAPERADDGDSIPF